MTDSNKKVRLLGIPTDRNSSYLRGSAKGPKKIRELFHSGMTNHTAESGDELGKEINFGDSGDLLLTGTRENEFNQIYGGIRDMLKEEHVPILLGGDHSITYPAVKALSEQHGPLNILHIDAHPDLYNNFDSNPYSHASPFARIMENGFAARLLQLGVRTFNKHQREQAERFDVKLISNEDIAVKLVVMPPSPLYISIDLDGFDPAYAPGVSHHEPGGLSVRQVLELFQLIDTPIVGCDIVEYNPERDIHNMTAAVAVKLIKELAPLAAGYSI